MIYIGILFALLAGVFITTQGSINGILGSQFGVVPTICATVAVQIVLLGILLFLRRDLALKFTGLMVQTESLKYGIAVGLLGFGIMTTLIISVMRVGPLFAFAIVVFSQLVTSMIIEHYGFFEVAKRSISTSRIGGLALILLGIVFFYR